MAVINPEIISLAFDLFGDDFEELLGWISEFHVDAEEAASLADDRKSLVSLDSEVDVEERLEIPVDGHQFVVTQRSLLRGKRGKVAHENPGRLRTEVLTQPDCQESFVFPFLFRYFLLASLFS